MTGKTDAAQGAAFRAARAAAAKNRVAILTDTRVEILRYLTLAQQRLTELLAAQPTEAAAWMLPQIQAQVAQAMTEFATSASGSTSSAATTAWREGQALIDAPLGAGGIRIEGVVPMLDVRQLQAMRTFMADRIKDVGIQAANRINTELGLVTIGAQSTADAVSKVATLLGDAPRARALNIARTELSRVYAVAAQERALQAVEVVADLQKQWRRSGKVHSRIAHDLADGQVQDMDKPFVLANGVRLMMPHDPKAPAKDVINCGCTSLPFRKAWEVSTPGRKRYTELEMQRNPTKRDIQEQIDTGKSMRQILEGNLAA